MMMFSFCGREVKEDLSILLREEPIMLIDIRLHYYAGSYYYSKQGTVTTQKYVVYVSGSF